VRVPDPRPARRRATIPLLGILAVVGFVGFAALGTWQIERRAWKHELVARVEARVQAEPSPPPTRAEWSAVSTSDAYRRLRLDGRFLNDRETLVQAVTEYGAGSWVMTPLVLSDGTTVLVNRGFVPSDRSDPASRDRRDGPVVVTGLLRLSEPGGAFLRSNDPAADRWYSRDVAAIAASRSLSQVAPYFVDVQAVPGAQGLPVAGLTVIAFPDNHLVYALTWYALALMVAGAYGYLLLDARRTNRQAASTTRAR